jgi:hypothetical protein
MNRYGLAALLIFLAASSARAEEIFVSVVGTGQAGPQKLCVIGREGNAFWAIEQIATNSFPAPKVSLQPFDGREERFAEVVAMLTGPLTDMPGWQEKTPEAPYVQLALVRDSADDETRRTLYLPGRGVAPQVEGLFAELRRYGMDCLPPVLR